MGLGADAWLTLVVIAGCLSLLIGTRIAADAVLLAGVGVLLLANVLTAEEALSGLANEGMATVAVLFVVARALKETGVVSWISTQLLGRPKSIPAAQFRLMVPVALSSSVLNNTPVVAMLIPAVRDWARRNKLAISQLMMPLSYAAIIGGTCTLVGTSTNLVVNGMLMETGTGYSLSMFELAWVGLPCVVLVIAFTLASSRWLLPNRDGGPEPELDVRKYTVEMLVEQDSSLAGRSIEEAGLRQLPGLFLVEINRGGTAIGAPSPQEILLSGDRLVFAGDVRAVVDLKNIHGLVVAEDQVFKLSADQSARCLVEVVVSADFPMLGKTVKDMGFRHHYSAAIISLSRNGEDRQARIGDMTLEPGDTLLLETHDSFVEQQQFSRDFLLASKVEDSRPVRHEFRKRAAFILAAMVLLVSFNLLSMFEASLLAAAAMVATRCIRIHDARNSINWQVLLVIAASIALGVATEKTGIAGALAELIVTGASTPTLTLAAIFAVTALLTAVISNLAAAVLMYPVVIAAATQLGVSPLPLVITLMFAASSCFSTPIGYQTNLMVYGPGDYRFSDFLKIGMPLTVLVGALCLFLIPLVWPFHPL